MRYADADHRRGYYSPRLVIAASAALLFLGAGLTLRGHSLANDDAYVAVANALAQNDAATLRRVGRTEAARPLSTVVTDATPDQEKMQGNWKIVHYEFAGEEGIDVVGVEDTISGLKWLRPRRRTGEYQLKLDSTKNPKWVNLSTERLGDKTLKGIYLLEGDKLTICYAYDPELPRPTEFKTMPGVKGYLYVLERVKIE